MEEITTPPIETKEMPQEFTVKIPDCCTEGRDDCPHVLNKPQREKRKNIAL